ncbi:MAG TPA: aldo/keto reductase [Gemmatimonadaceae bacterium]|nr:aldo/keto reductase [Gemmatimonadaceae bacterium]
MSPLPSRRAFLAGAAASLLGLRGGRPTRARMLTRTIPSSGEAVPAVGMGTWQTFDPPSLSAESLAPLEEVLRVFRDAGGRLVDSSPMYGKSEDVTGRLSERIGANGELFIATKVWTSGERAGARQMEESMRLLHRPRQLDLIQVHNLVDWRTHLATLRRWKEAGRVRYIGVTHYQTHAFDELERVIRREKVDFIQLPYSIALRDAERRLLPAAAESGTAVLVNRPFEGGDLFGQVRGKPVPDFVRPFAESWAQAFLKFILAHPAVTCVIPATSKPRNMRDNVAAGAGRLPDEGERERLVRLFA